MERERWPSVRTRFSQIFESKTRDEWTAIFENVDACVTPVLSPREAVDHRYNADRNVFATSDVVQPQPAPRFSKTPGAIMSPPHQAGADTLEGLSRWGISVDRQDDLRAAGAFS
jgi:alpha-methylacyl-CoA racemase